jgi:hypothetical protein
LPASPKRVEPLLRLLALVGAARESGIALHCIPGLLESAARWRGDGLDLAERVSPKPKLIANAM